jgi:hypothetical protein
VTAENAPDPAYLADVEPGDGVFISFNSFHYWDKFASTDPLHEFIDLAGPTTFHAQFGGIYKQFECFFNGPLAVVVGGAVNLVDPQFTTISWDGLASLLNVPGIQFSARRNSIDPNQASVPTLEQMQIPGVPGTPTVLVNEGFAGMPPRPALWLDFDRPQRAVGLEFGFKNLQGVPRDKLGRSVVVLTAFDRSDNVLTFADSNNQVRTISTDAATPLVQSVGVLSGSFANRIGVADWNGRISAVKLEFGGDVVEPQVLLRVWHEAPLPAAVRQGFLVVDSAPNLPPAPPAEPYPRSMLLPALCDRALVMLRGFKFMFLDGNDHTGLPHSLTSLGVGFTAPFDYTTDPGGAITLNPSGNLSTGEMVSPPTRILLYYTLLAWDSTQVELQTQNTSVFGANGNSGDNLNLHLQLPDNSCAESRPIPPELERIRCGQLFGAPISFQFDTSEPKTITEIDLTTGHQFNGRLHRNVENGMNTIDWEVSPYLQLGGDGPFRFSFEGIVISGRSLRSGADHVVTPNDDRVSAGNFGSVGLPVPSIGPRANADTWQIGWSGVRDFTIAWPVVDTPGDPQFFTPDVPADVAFVSFGDWELRPGGAFLSKAGTIRQLEVELRGERYDGRVVDWQAGLGISIETGNPGEEHYAFAYETCGAVVRRTRFARAQLLAQGPSWAGISDTTVPCADVGSLINAGDAAVSITDIQRGGPSDARFDYNFYYHGGVYSFDQLRALLPLRLRPADEPVLIGGTFTAEFVSANAQVLDLGYLFFQTNDLNQQSVTVTARGWINPGGASGVWQPDFIDFGNIPSGTSANATATLLSNGRSRLVISGFQPPSPQLGFTYDSPPAFLDPGQSVDIHFTYTNNIPPFPPPGPGHGGNPPPPPRFETHVFSAVTNAGYIPMTLIGAQLPPTPIFHPPPGKGGPGSGPPGRRPVDKKTVLADYLRRLRTWHGFGH